MNLRDRKFGHKYFEIKISGSRLRLRASSLGLIDDDARYLPPRHKLRRPWSAHRVVSGFEVWPASESLYHTKH